jgi:hypothetical protein
LVTFDGSASSDPDGDALNYRWEFGDGGTSNMVKPSHTYQQDGTYNVSLTVTDARGAASPPASTSAAVSRGVVLVGAGNVASGGGNSSRTAALLDNIPGTVFTAGDNAFPNGSGDDYTRYYVPTWGRFLSRTRPALGNHDYNDNNAKGSFDYFGDRLGQRGLGYYSYDLGSWHIVVLNDKGSQAIDDAQLQWLQNDLQSNSSKRCTIAIWHIPLFQSSNTKGGYTNSIHRGLWDLLYQYGVEIAINAQPHHYERMKPLTPSGVVDNDRGIREFIVGMGGGDGVIMPEFAYSNSETRAAAFGVLKLTLKQNGYDWQFVPVQGESYTDSGSAICH